MEKTNNEIRSDYARMMKKVRKERNEKIESVDDLPIPWIIKKKVKRRIYKNFDGEIEEIQGQQWYEKAKQTHLAEINSKIKLAKTPPEVIEFRKSFVDSLEKVDGGFDVTKEKLKKIVELWEDLVESGYFHFEKSEYGNIWVLKLWQKTMKFLSIDHPQDFNNKLTHKIWDKCVKDFDFKLCSCPFENIKSLVPDKSMPWWYVENEWIVELMSKVKDSTWLGQLSIDEMKTVISKLQEFCKKYKGIEFNNSNDYLLLYMYLMWPSWWFWWYWLSDGLFYCDRCRILMSRDGCRDASLFFGLLA